MPIKKKSNAGRKMLTEDQKRVPVTIWVRAIHKPKAQVACAAIANKYR